MLFFTPFPNPQNDFFLGLPTYEQHTSQFHSSLNSEGFHRGGCSDVIHGLIYTAFYF